jgi:hypothetical protein
MLKARVILLALAVVFVVSASASAVAQAKGPVWHVNKKVLESKEIDEITDGLAPGSSAKLVGTVAGLGVTIICKTVMSHGELIGGNPGKDKEEIRFTNCELMGSPACVVTVAPTHAVSELDHAVGGTEPKKILVDFSAESGRLFTTITIANKGTETCTTKITNAEVKVATGATYGVACETSPEEKEAEVNVLTCPETAIKEVEQGEQGQPKVAVGLEFAGKPATFSAIIDVKQVSHLPFGPFQT